MSAKKRILFIANEMSPYLELTEFSEIVNKLAIKANDNNFEVRCIMPRFGIINERRHRLHEVVRLSGINVSVDNDDMPLQIKWPPCPVPAYRYISWIMKNSSNASLFSMMSRKNGMKTMTCVRCFSVKEPLETVKNLAGRPDIIHCSGWMTGLIPAYLKTVYKKNPFLHIAKLCIQSDKIRLRKNWEVDFYKESPDTCQPERKRPGIV
jgi:starch synthase